MEPRHIVWITLDNRLFSTRYGFGGESEFGTFLHQFLVRILEATKLSDDETEYRSDYKSVQVGTYYGGGTNGPSKRYHVPEAVAQCFYSLNKNLRKKAEAFCTDQEAKGKNLLLQMLKSDVLGEALSS